jgi:tetratricopeptide (TPR) repeat protein
MHLLTCCESNEEAKMTIGALNTASRFIRPSNNKGQMEKLSKDISEHSGSSVKDIKTRVGAELEQGTLLLASGKNSDAMGSFQAALRDIKTLPVQEQQSPEIKDALVQIRTNYGGALLNLNQNDASEKQFQKVIDAYAPNNKDMSALTDVDKQRLTERPLRQAHLGAATAQKRMEAYPKANANLALAYIEHPRHAEDHSHNENVARQQESVAKRSGASTSERNEAHSNKLQKQDAAIANSGESAKLKRHKMLRDLGEMKIGGQRLGALAAPIVNSSRKAQIPRPTSSAMGTISGRVIANQLNASARSEGTPNGIMDTKLAKNVQSAFNHLPAGDPEAPSYTETFAKDPIAREAVKQAVENVPIFAAANFAVQTNEYLTQALADAQNAQEAVTSVQNVLNEAYNKMPSTSEAAEIAMKFLSHPIENTPSSTQVAQATASLATTIHTGLKATFPIPEPIDIKSAQQTLQTNIDVQINKGKNELAQGKSVEALKSFQAAEKLYETASSGHKHNPEMQGRLTSIHLSTADALLNAKQFNLAGQRYQTIINHQQNHANQSTMSMLRNFVTDTPLRKVSTMDAAKANMGLGQCLDKQRPTSQAPGKVRNDVDKFYLKAMIVEPKGPELKHNIEVGMLREKLWQGEKGSKMSDTEKKNLADIKDQLNKANSDYKKAFGVDAKVTIESPKQEKIPSADIATQAATNLLTLATSVLSEAYPNQQKMDMSQVLPKEFLDKKTTKMAMNGALGAIDSLYTDPLIRSSVENVVTEKQLDAIDTAVNLGKAFGEIATEHGKDGVKAAVGYLAAEGTKSLARGAASLATEGALITASAVGNIGAGIVKDSALLARTVGNKLTT